MSQVTSAQNGQQDSKEKRHHLLLYKAQPKSIDLLSARNTVAKSILFSQKSHRMHSYSKDGETVWGHGILETTPLVMIKGWKAKE